MDVRVARVYGDVAPDGGVRVLIDRLWPRGVTKDAVDTWIKDVAPSAELRQWYGHDPDRYEEFRRRYDRELAKPAAKEALLRLRTLAERDGHGVITLLTASRALDISHAAVLRDKLSAT